MVVGDEKTGKYLAMDDGGLRILHHLKKHTIGETEKAFPKHDVRGFVQKLTDKGLVHRIDHRVHNPRHVASIIDIEPEKLAWTKHPLAKGSLIALIVVGLYLLITIPQLVPIPAWFFSIGLLAVIIPLAFIICFIVTFVHELGHYVALRRTGHPTSMTIVHRWHLILPHTDLSGAAHLTPRERAKVHLGGLMAELGFLGALIVLLAIGVWPALLELAALITFVDILFQVTPFNGTDLTVTAEHAFGIEGLPGMMAKGILKGCFACKKRPRHEQEAFKTFLPAFIIGLLIFIILVIVYALPIFIEIIRQSVLALLVGGAAHDAALFTDGMLSLLLTTIFLSFASIGTIREHALSAKKWFTWTAMLIYVLFSFVAVYLLAAGLVLFAHPITTTVALYFIGVVYGVLFTRLLESVPHLRKSTLLPVAAAATALMLVLLLGWLASATGLAHVEPIYGIAYAVGMLTSLIV